MSVVLHFQSTGTMPGDARPVTMRGGSLTLGRGDENDLVLPDPDRLVSKRHCAIEDRDGNIVAVDLSTNGTFLNYGKAPIGAAPAPLNDGDILTVGRYELMVEIQAAAEDPLLPPMARGAAAPPPHRGTAAILGDGPEPDDDDDFLNDLLGGGAPSGPGQVQRPELGEDGLLPPLGADDPAPGDPFAEGPDPGGGQGASASDHGAAMHDSFAAPRAAPSAIPDDWDDLLAPADLPPADPPPADPPAAAPPPPQPAPPQPAPPQAAPSPEPPPSPAPPAPAAADHVAAAPSAPAAPESPDAVSAAAPVPELPPEAPPPMPPGEDAAGAPAPAAPVPSNAPAPSSSPAPAPIPAPAPAASPAPAQVARGADQDAARAFLKSLGAEGLNLPPEELVPTLSRLGHVLRFMIAGMREILMTRSAIKSEFRIEQTRITAGGNNPLKFSISPEQAIEAMVRPTTQGYLDAAEATQQALTDIKAHEVAMMTGMEAALKGVLAQLSPEALEGKIQDSGGLSGLLKGRKARYWEVYEKIYGEIADAAENDFHELFAREFARAYQQQLERLK